MHRYEVELDLPVRRPAGKSRGSVLATCPELDGWIATSPLKRSHSLSRQEASSELSILRASVSETRKLRNEAQALRLETHECVALLQQNVARLREQLMPKE